MTAARVASEARDGDERRIGPPPWFAEHRLDVRRAVEQKLAPWTDDSDVGTVLDVASALDDDPAQTMADDRAWHDVAVFEALGRLSLGEAALPFAAHAGVVVPLLDTGAAALPPRLQRGPVFSHSLLDDEGDGIGVVAHREGDEYVLHGSVSGVVNATSADAHCVVARLPDGRSPAGRLLLLVPADVPGVGIGRAGGAMAPLVFDGARVPAALRVGADATGPADRDRHVRHALLLVACAAVAAAERCLEETGAHAETRVTFGSPLRGHQAVRLALAELATAVEATRRLVYAAVQAGRATPPDGLRPAAAQLRARRLVRHVAETCMGLHGAAGYLDAHPVARFVDDAHAFNAATGTDDALLRRIARARGLDAC